MQDMNIHKQSTQDSRIAGVQTQPKGGHSGMNDIFSA